MSVNELYGRRLGRMLMIILQKTGMFRFASWYLTTRISRVHIPGYIRRNKINMEPYNGSHYGSFAEFFARKRPNQPVDTEQNVLVSPCDGLLSYYQITLDMVIPMKGSHYRIEDLVPDGDVASQFKNGLCLVFRLQASDYHHFCSFDDMELGETGYIPGLLHSVQPIACETVPVYRLNRRWWNVLQTRSFGTAVQVEIGAMMVGGISLRKGDGYFRKGDELGWFELAGSTIILLLSEESRKKLTLYPQFEISRDGLREVPVAYGRGIGILKPEGKNSDIVEKREIPWVPG